MNRYNYTEYHKVYGETYNYIVERKLIVWKLKRLSYIKLVNGVGMRACKRNGLIKGRRRATRTGGERIRSLRKDRGPRKKERSEDRESEKRSIEAE